MVKKRLLFILCLAFVMASAAVAQTKTVTNHDLEKFRQKRVSAERDLRENYVKLGFPSPEELEKQNGESRLRLSELSRRLEAEKIEREKNDFLRLQAEAAEATARVNYLRPAVQTHVIYEPIYRGGSYITFFGKHDFRSRHQSRYFDQWQYRNRYTQLNVPMPTIQTLPLRMRPPVFINAAPQPTNTGINGNRGGRRN